MGRSQPELGQRSRAFRVIRHYNIIIEALGGRRPVPDSRSLGGYFESQRNQHIDHACGSSVVESVVFRTAIQPILSILFFQWHSIAALA